LIFLGFIEGPPFSIFYGGDPYQYAFGVILYVVGFTLFVFGDVATFFKVNSEMMAVAINKHHLSDDKPEKPILTA